MRDHTHEDKEIVDLTFFYYIVLMCRDVTKTANHTLTDFQPRVLTMNTGNLDKSLEA